VLLRLRPKLYCYCHFTTSVQQTAVKPPMAVTNAVSWRSEGIRHKKNEVFLDVVESVNLLVNSNGNVVLSEVRQNTSFFSWCLLRRSRLNTLCNPSSLGGRTCRQNMQADIYELVG
jgi:hypothetical protein